MAPAGVSARQTATQCGPRQSEADTLCRVPVAGTGDCYIESDTLSRGCDSIISYTSPIGESPVLSREWNDGRSVGLPPVALTLDWAAKHAVEELEVPQYQQQDWKPEDGHEVQR
jgi:hypothetical protein